MPGRGKFRRRSFLLLIPHAVAAAGIAVAACALMTAVSARARLDSPPETPLFEDRYGRYLAESSTGHDLLGFWEVPAPTPKRISRCLLAIEDKRFYKHAGVDARALLRALSNNLFQGRREGASTIPMQVARLRHPSPRTLGNKLLEIAEAFVLIKRYGHEAVFRHYMKIVPLGNQIHGFAYAARRYFQKPLEDLSWTEAAILAALPKAPGAMNLYSHRGFLSSMSRGNLILELLLQEGILDSQAYRQSLRELSRRYTPLRPRRPEHSYHVILRLLESYEAGAGLSKPKRTTLDMDLQAFLQGLASRAMKKYRPYGAGNTAMIVVDRQNGDVLAYLGSENYFDERFSGSIDYVRTLRSSGSTLKPFLYALGLQTRTFSPASILADLPLSILDPGGRRLISYSNVDDEFLGPMLYRRALANSRNIPTIRVLAQVGLQEAYDFFAAIGLHGAERPAEYYGYGLVLGGLYVTLEDLVRAYGILAGGGKEFRLRWFLEDDPEVANRILSEATARQISLFLSDPLARLPTFSRLSSLEFPFPVAIKTGTSQGYRDAWSMAYSSKYVVGTWLGHPDNQRMNHVGSSAASELVQQILLYLQPEESRGINEQPFPPPRNHVPVRLCRLSGDLAGPDCPQVALEYFPDTAVPGVICRQHQRFAVDKRSGRLADSRTPPRYVKTQVFAALQPEYSAWAEKNGFVRPPLDASPRETSIKIVQPTHGSRLLIDPETPADFQTLALLAEVEPSVPSIVWFVDGEQYRQTDYPYQTRWRLEEGTHTFQAKFLRANIFSEIVSVRVSAY